MIIYVLIVIYKIVTVIMKDKFEGAIYVDDRCLISLNNPVLSLSKAFNEIWVVPDKKYIFSRSSQNRPKWENKNRK